MSKGPPPETRRLESAGSSSQETIGSQSLTSIGSTSNSSNYQKDKEKGHSFSSLFHPHRAHDPRDNQTLTALLAPAVHVAGAHNPFIIGGMKEDGSRTRPSRDSLDRKDHYQKDDKDSLASEDASSRSFPRQSRRHRIRSAFGRSLSPWRFHSDGEKKRSSGVGGSAFSRLSCRDSLDVEREKKANGVEDRESGIESDGESVKGGIAPRNNAFGDTSDSEDSEEDGMGRDGGYKGNDGRKSSRIEKERNEKEKEDEASVEPLEEEEEEENDDDDDDGKNSGEESDDYIDFDEKTLDNTLFNAGCIDLHDAWLKHDGHSHHDRTPDEKLEDLAAGDGYYGPNDYDAAWEGAGPSGHDEDDEALRAPNVVIGQSNVISPSKLMGEGAEVINNGNQDDKSSKLSPSSHRKSSTSISSKATSSLSSSKSNFGDEGQLSEKDSSTNKSHRLTASRPIFERNRCTITLIHGNYEERAKESKRPKRYIVASDGSEESSYAIEWTIGTVLRDGDEMLVVSVMETDAKLDSTDPKHEDKMLRQEHQRIRQSMAVILARRALAVLQRTRLAVKVSCQALHARHSRHMFIDMIDFFEPTMCIVGSRGLNSLKGVLLGSFSNYCVQKSPVPVMVARKRLKLPALPKGKGDVVSNVRARHMRLDEAIIEKDANIADTPQEEQKEQQEEEEEQTQKDDDKAVEENNQLVKEAISPVTAAEKVKEEAISKGSEEAEEVPSSMSDTREEPNRGRAKFALDDEDNERGRSRSRTTERNNSR